MQTLAPNLNDQQRKQEFLSINDEFIRRICQIPNWERLFGEDTVKHIKKHIENQNK